MAKLLKTSQSTESLTQEQRNICATIWNPSVTWTDETIRQKSSASVNSKTLPVSFIGSKALDMRFCQRERFTESICRKYYEYQDLPKTYCPVSSCAANGVDVYFQVFKRDLQDPEEQTEDRTGLSP